MAEYQSLNEVKSSMIRFLDTIVVQQHEINVRHKRTHLCNITILCILYTLKNAYVERKIA